MLRNEVTNFLRYRELLKNLVLKELRLRHKRSFLGFFWSVLNPLLMMIVFTLVFSRRFEIEKYPAFILTGLLPWNFFAIALANAVHSLLSHGNLIKQVYFPRAIIPIAIVLAYFTNFLFALIPLGLLLVFFKIKIGLAIFFLPLVMLAHLIFTLGLGLALAALNVFFRDVAEILEVATLAWFFLTPIIYSGPGLSAGEINLFYQFNPMFYFIELYHQILYCGLFPSLKFILISLVWAILSFSAGWIIFHRSEPIWVKEL